MSIKGRKCVKHKRVHVKGHTATRCAKFSGGRKRSSVKRKRRLASVATICKTKPRKYKLSDGTVACGCNTRRGGWERLPKKACSKKGKK